MQTRKNPTDPSLQKVLKPNTTVAIVAFWRKEISYYADAQAEFKCYHYFYVPNPKTQTVMMNTVQLQPLKKFLYRTSKHQCQEDEKIFFFFKDDEKQRDFKLAVLNCEPKTD